MKQLVPQAKNIVAYLLAKGQAIADIEYMENNIPFTVFMTPPSRIGIEDEHFRLNVPVFQDTVDYRQYVDIIIAGIATIYQVDKVLLVRFFSRPLEQLFDTSLEMERKVMEQLQTIAA